MDLSTEYLGLTLRNPLVASASPLSQTVDGVRRLADAGVGAVVLYSLFEEQLRHQAAVDAEMAEKGAEQFAEALTYFPDEAEVDPGPFVALKPLERIALEPGTTMVATEFPRALLADWGLPVSPDRAGEPVRAEMLYSADGEPLAVRLLN